MIIFFSGTGNSKYCADYLANKLGDEAIDSLSYIKNQIAFEASSQKPWIFVAPTYAWQLPRIFESFIRTGTFEGSREAYFVMTCGSDIAGAGYFNKRLSDEKGFNYRGTLELVMPENYIAMFPVPEDEEASKIVSKAMPNLKEAALRILDGEDIEDEKDRVGLSKRIKSSILPKFFYPMFVKSKKFWVKDACNGCSLCEKLCPLNNITVEDGSPKWHDNCTHCMACICRCPMEAIEYGKISKGKNHYVCKDFEEER